MVHGDHNKNRSGGFFLIILGALIFITSPLYLADSPQIVYHMRPILQQTLPSMQACLNQLQYEILPHAHNSYGEHMSSLLLEGLDDLGIQYEFRRAYDTYSRGDLVEQIHTILSQRESIGKKIADMVGQEKFTKYLPYYAVCADCKRLYTTESLEYDGEKRAISYVCKDAEIGGNLIKGCGHEGVSRIGVDLGKLAWKVEFAARWAAYDIRFEAYGKDIMDSVHVNDWVAENILGYAPPHHVKYEMFLDRRGKKISKSLGNVITSQRWLKYGTKQSLLLLLYKRITGARELGFEDIPSLMDEYHELEVAYFSDGGSGNAAKDAKMRGLYEYVIFCSRYHLLHLKNMHDTHPSKMEILKQLTCSSNPLARSDCFVPYLSHLCDVITLPSDFDIFLPLLSKNISYFT